MNLLQKVIFSLGFFAICLVYFWFASYGTGDLVGKEPEVLGTAYDYLAKSFLEFNADVPADSVGIEGIQNRGKTFVYYGPFPALLRIIPNLIFPEMFGHWSRTSCLIANILSLIWLTMITQLALTKNSQLSLFKQGWLLTYMLLAFGLASPLIFLVSDSMLYVEAISWGLSLSLLGLWSILSCLFSKHFSRKHLIILSTAAALALLTRITFAIPLYLMLVYFVVREFHTHRSNSTQYSMLIWPLLIILLPASGGVLMQLWYNWARFDSPFIFLAYQMVYPNPAHYGGETNLLRIPISLYNFFSIRVDALTSNPPYILSLKPVFTSARLYMPWNERIISLTLTAPWMVISALIGAYSFLRSEKNIEWKICALVFLLQATMILSWHYFTYRYVAELLPLMVFFIVFALTKYDFFAKPHYIRAALLMLMIGTLATPLSTIHFHMMGVGDTGLQKQNRPLLFSIFYPKVEMQEQQNHETIASDNWNSDCASSGEQIIRGTSYPNSVALSPGCVIKFKPDPAVTQLKALVALSDARHDCENFKARLVITDSLKKSIFESKPLSQMDAAQVIDLPLSGSGEVNLIFEELTPGAGCVHGIVSGLFMKDNEGGESNT
jgi:hypothetical protein